MDSIERELFIETRRLLLVNRNDKRQGRLFPIIMFLLFAASLFSLLPIFDLCIIVAAMVLHEAGHYLAMRLFGYTDLKIFFFPFIGAAVSGHRLTGENSWREAVVLLAGPMPGMVGGICWFLLGPSNPQVDIAAWWVIVLNGFNLLPLMPLDGGRLMNLVLFSRHYLLEMFFLTLTSAALILMGLYLHNYLLGAVGVISLCSVPLRYRLTRIANCLRPDWANESPDIKKLSIEQHQRLFRLVRSGFSKDSEVQIQLLAKRMESVHRLAHVSPLSVSLSVVLVIIYAGLISLSLISLEILAKV